MLQILFIVFFISLCIFAGIMARDPRTLWSGASFFGMMLCMALYLFFLVSQYSEWLALVFFVIAAMGSVIVFPAVLMLMFFVEGIRMIRHEGMKPSNLLSMLFSVLV